MRSVWQSCIIAFSLYSKIPMKMVPWNSNTMKYVMIFFPLVGGVIAAVIYGWWQLALFIQLEPLLSAVVAVVIPLVITGGIHMDGFCDTVDGLSSHQDRERKLDIMKDPNIGAFATITVVCYLLGYTALWTQLVWEKQAISIIALGFVLSRVLSGLAVVWFPCAKDSGLAATFADYAHKKVVAQCLSILAMLCILVMLWCNVRYSVMVILACAVLFLYYRVMSYREFGGITGDLAGYFLQLCELIILLAVVLAQLILR